MNDPLQTIIKQDRTNWRAFPLVFAVVLFLMIFLGGLLSLILVGTFFPSFGLLNQMLILSLAVAAGFSLGNRLKALHVDHAHLSQKELRELATRVIESMGFSCEHANKKCVFRNTRKFHRWFSDWLGTEQIVLSPEGTGILLTGPARYLNDLNHKLIEEDPTS